MLSFTHLALRRGTQLLFENVSFTIPRRAKTGLVGANGSGKSSLFQLVTRQLESDVGNVECPAGTRIAHMAQEVTVSDEATVDYVLAGDAEYVAISERLDSAERLEAFEALAELHELMDNIDGYSARSRAEQLMIGLGFTQHELEQPVASFSGGWQSRLNLARTLMQPSDLLLLDEPTNHLDLDAILWLSSWLKSYAGTLILISHDRVFLDECVNGIAYIYHQTIELFPGNYSHFEMLKAARLAEQHSNYVRQQREIEHMQDFVRRFRAKATKARQAQSRLKALARMERIAPAHIDSPFHFLIPTADKTSNPLLKLDGADLGYDEVILSNISLGLHPGDRLGLLGHNGAGKSTLIKSLAGQIDLLGGDRTSGINLKTGYYSQQQVDNLDLAQSAFRHIEQLDPAITGQEIRDYLGGFNFHGDKVGEPVRLFSGGEKARLALAMIAFQAPNLLLMDEPTNHLDMEMCQALTVALQEFSGAIVLISHDRHLLANSVNEFLLVDHGTVQPFDGDLNDYRNKVFHETPSQSKTPEAEKTAPATNNKTARQLRTRMRTLEQQLDRLQRKLTEVETELSKPDIYNREDGASLQQLLKDQLELKQQINTAETEWLQHSKKLDD